MFQVKKRQLRTTMRMVKKNQVDKLILTQYHTKIKASQRKYPFGEHSKRKSKNGITGTKTDNCRELNIIN